MNTKKPVGAVVGVATAGIPHATLVADEYNLPLAYARSSPKKHGTGNKVEGRLEKGQNVIVIEDLISTAGSSMEAVETVRAMGCRVEKLLAIFTYELDKAADCFRQDGIQVETLTNYSTLIEVALSAGYVQEADLTALREWRNDPENWART